MDWGLATQQGVSAARSGRNWETHANRRRRLAAGANVVGADLYSHLTAYFQQHLRGIRKVRGGMHIARTLHLCVITFAGS